MSADLLRRAAALMRERAEAATEGPWEDFAFADGSVFVERVGLDDDDVGNEIGCINRTMDAEHIASWHPAVALAVADLLDVVAAWVDEFGGLPESGEMEIVGRRCFAVARAYLGADQ